MNELRNLFVLIFLAGCLSLPSQPWSQNLPKPSGNFKIGHRRFEWTDSSRLEILATNKNMREIVADVWYPAENIAGDLVPYLDTVAIVSVQGEDGLRSLLGEQAVLGIRSTKTHAYQGAPFSRSIKLAPVIFFSHGMGMITQLYTAQIEELASHGYIVVALQHSYDAWLISFSNGKHIAFETTQRNAAGNTEEKHIAYENKRLEWWAGDISFALDQLVLMNSTKEINIPFTGHMDFSKVGAMGHSSGGRAAARVCQLDPRIKSCADLDGVAMMQPFYLNQDGHGMTQPFLLFERVRNQPITEADAASIGMTLQDVLALVKRLRKGKEDALAATGGSFHILLDFDSSSHMSFSDLPLLQAKNHAEVKIAYELLQVTCRYTREFFDKTLRKIPAPLFDTKMKLNYIELLRRYPKSQ